MKRWPLAAALLLATVSTLDLLAADPWDEVSGAVGQVEMPSGRVSGAALERLVAAGEKLFTAKFTRAEGAGRPGATQAILPTRSRAGDERRNPFARTSGSDANACSACHNDPVLGGAGDFVTTTFVTEGFSNATFDSTDPQFSNERGSNHLFGAGLIELLAREMTEDLASQRREALVAARDVDRPVEMPLETKGVSFGAITVHPDGTVDPAKVEGVDADLVVRPFSQKGVMTSLRQFTVNATNHHHGMQAGERFGRRFTGTDDHDADGFASELSDADVSALVAWQATLPPPGAWVPDDPRWREAAAEGSRHFDEFRCSACHIRELPLRSLDFLDPGPVDAAGTLSTRDVERPATYDLASRDSFKRLRRNEKGEWLVPLFGDLKRHAITSPGRERLGNELLSQRFVERGIFATAELWGIGSTAPYGHRNDMTTLDEVIRAHGGEATASAEAYENAGERERSALIAFLKTLRITER